MSLPLPLPTSLVDHGEFPVLRCLDTLHDNVVGRFMTSLARVLHFDHRLSGRILHLAGPVVVGMLVQTLINVIDTLLVGQLPTDRATPGQAALEVSILLLWFFGGFLGAVAVGTQALVARRLGEGNPHAAAQVLTNSVAMAVLASTAVTAALWIATPYLFPLLNHDPQVLEVGIPYWRWRLASMLSMVGILSVKSFFDGIGQTWVHMVVSISINVVNLILAWGLIFGHWGMPRLEVEGAGVAAAISSYLGLALMLLALHLPRFRKSFPTLQLRQLSARVAGDIARLSFPSAVATMVVMTGFGLFYRIVAETDLLRGGGTVHFTATAIIVRVLSLFFIAALGYATATATLVSQSMGEGKPDLAERYGWESVRIGVCAAMVISLATIGFAPQILAAFTHDAAVAEVARPALRLAGAFEPLMIAALVFTQAHFGAGNSRLVMTVELGLHFGCLVPLTYLFGVILNLGMMGIWLAVGAYMLLLASILGWRFHTGSWKQISI